MITIDTRNKWRFFKCNRLCMIQRQAFKRLHASMLAAWNRALIRWQETDEAKLKSIIFMDYYKSGYYREAAVFLLANRKHYFFILASANKSIIWGPSCDN